MTRRGWIVWLVGAAALAVTGCAEKLTYDRWQTLRIGASPEEVEATLGDPWQREDTTWVYYDDDKQISVTAVFAEEGLVRTTWSDPDHPMQAKGDMGLAPGEKDEIKVQTFKK